VTSRIVETTSGPVDGVDDGGVARWLGIPYAAAPVGARRWCAPVSPTPWTEPRPATAYGAAAPQVASPLIAMSPGVGFDEDCLTLNVWASSSIGPGDARPVLFWVHGGAYVFGSSAQTVYDGRALAASGQVVLVTVNYRLGALGFLDLSAWDPEADANPALRDLLLALAWVRDNIAGFGGDPSQVTLWGESAGGGLVSTLLAVPSAAGLAHRAIVHSSPATSVYGSARARSVAERLFEAAGLETGDVAGLRALPADRLVELGMLVLRDVPTADPGTLAFAPVVDGDLLREHPVAAIRAGRGHPIPLLIGTNRDEASMFKHMSSPLMPIDADAIERMFAAIAAEHPDLTLPDRAQVMSAYSGLRPSAIGMGIAGDIGFRMPTIWLAEGQARVAPVHLYRFDWATPMLTLLGIGATHATELPYVFGNLDGGPKDITFRLGGRHRGSRIADRMQARWLAYAVDGDPNAPGLPEWPAYAPEARATLVIDAADRIVDDLDRQRREAWGEAVVSFD